MAGALWALMGAPGAQAHGQSEERRYILTLAEPADDLKALRHRVRRTAGVHVSTLSALSPTQVTLTLRCRSAARCDQALSRLSGATAWVRSVDVDAVRAPPAPVAASAAR